MLQETELQSSLNCHILGLSQSIYFLYTTGDEVAILLGTMSRRLGRCHHSKKFSTHSC